MKKVTKLSLALLFGGLLTACGSSGNNNVSEQKNDLTNNNARHHIVEIVVDGKTLPVEVSAAEGKDKGSAVYSKLLFNRYEGLDASVPTMVIAYADLDFDASILMGVNNGYAFAKGNATPISNMPTSGEATYNVEVYSFYSNGFQIGNSDERVDMTDNTKGLLKADFGNKTLNGYIQSHRTRYSINDIEIKGNTFRGEMTGNEGTAEVGGIFSGKSAEYIGGVYQNLDPHKNDAGTFGGARKVTP